METYNWYEVTKRIKQELRIIINNHPVIFSDENIRLLEKILTYDINTTSYNLDGTENRIPTAFHKILVEGLTKDVTLSYFPDFAKIEPFLKKLLFIIDRPKFLNLHNQKKGLGRYIDELGINPLNIRLTNATIEQYEGQNHFAEHLVRAYKLRNTESHSCTNWSNRELYENVESLLIIYLYAISCHKNVLISILSQEPNIKPYLLSVIKNFEKWQKRFVHITGKEKFEEIDLYALENDDWSRSNNEKELREGKVDDLRQSIEENQMVLLGDPGMGKSTTLQYLAYKDAKLKLQTNDRNLLIPVFIELKLFSKGDNLIKVIQNKLKLTFNETKELIESGKLSIFLDGLNEVIKDIRKEIRIEIQNFILNYPENRVIITTRPLAYSDEFPKTPVFVLQKLQTNQINEFLTKNCSNSTVIKLIQEEIKSNDKFSKIVKVPLMLRMLINVALNNNGIIPKNKVLIIKKFINGLYVRETKKITVEFDYRVIHRLLCFLGFKSRELKGSNAGIRYEEIEAILEKRIEKSRFTLSAYMFLDIAMDLSIIVKDNDKYSFIHELYQEYYASEELLRINAKQKAA